ncbi:acetyl-CoA C-acyltransferase [Nitrospirillum sp. BR 11163]|uniref:thiolase family protein n=1 Tax=Nitrospirillum sp. BR 11163 TaxID=3104323 RepID=UPI002AFDD5DC|nr:acetyl-CoA C-acyltransferase [Nitrospirillum sp. BR 11163]MEA1672837.1 acetyl-CoA C-acyltransferase [Nitrospirillum sp. BR 11163]
MKRFQQDVYLASGLRTPFGRGGGALAGYDAIGLSVPVVQAMAKQMSNGRPDLVLWGTVIPSLGWSNIAREIWLDAKLDPTVPSFTAILACATSITASFAAAGMIGGGTDVILVGGVETMSRPPIGLTTATVDRLRALFAQDPAEALAALGQLTPADFVLPVKGWANRITGRTMGDHMEETAKQWGITREAQDQWAYDSHRRAAAGWDGGFFDDLVIPLPEIARDANVRADTTLEKLASLKPAFDRTSGKGTLTAGNSSPITDGAAGLWVVSAEGRRRLGTNVPTAKLIDHELAAIDFADGLLMATPYAIARLLNRHSLRFEDIALWEIHEAFAAQLLANVAALEKPGWISEKVGIARDFGRFPFERVNPNGGSIAIGHPFGATGARDLSQTVKELAAMPKGSKAIVSVCADGGEGAVALLENS